MRIRSIKPEFWESLDTAGMDYFTRLLYIGLWSYADDYGVAVDSPGLVQSKLFPNDGDDGDLSVRIHGALTELSNGGQIVRYRGPDNRPYLYICSWDSHQRVNRPTRSKFPRPTSDDMKRVEDSVKPQRELTEASLPEQGNKGTRDLGVKGSRKSRKRDEYADEFEDFWQAFPSERKANKQGCKSKFAAAIKNGVQANRIIDAAARYRDDPNREPAYTVAPHRWLNEERWEAPPLPARGLTHSGPTSRPNTHEAWSTPAGEPLPSELPTFDDVIEGEVLPFRRGIS